MDARTKLDDQLHEISQLVPEHLMVSTMPTTMSTNSTMKTAMENMPMIVDTA